jgi:hypothetical protein
MLPLKTLPPNPQRSEWFTSGLYCLQRKHPACECFLTWMFYREGLLAPHPTPKLEDHPSSAVRDCLFNLFAATLLIGGRSSIRNLRTRQAVVTGTLYMELLNYESKFLLLPKLHFLADCRGLGH